MLSGGGRQILASYTEFSYQGNFLDAACLLIDTLPHQSPAMRVRLCAAPFICELRFHSVAAATVCNSQSLHLIYICIPLSRKHFCQDFGTRLTRIDD